MMAKFSDVLTIINGKNQSKVENPNGKYPIYGSGGVMGRADDYICEADTIVIGRKGSINKPIYVDEPFWNVDTAFGLKADKTKLLPKYLFYFCLNFDFEKLNTTVTIPSLTKSNLFQVSIPLPDLPTQQRIADTLDKVSEGIEVCRRILGELDLMVKAKFVEMFGDAHNNSAFPYKNIGDLTTVTSGGTPDRENNLYWDDGDIRWVKTTELQNCTICDTEEKITKLGLENSSAKLVPTGSVLIAMYGQGKTRGMTAYLENESATNQACACVLPSSKINQKYLWQYLMLSYDALRAMAKGGNQPNLNISMIKNFPVLYPPMELQNQYVEFVTYINKSVLTIKMILAKMEMEKLALMQEYFKVTPRK